MLTAGKLLPERQRYSWTDVSWMLYTLARMINNFRVMEGGYLDIRQDRIHLHCSGSAGDRMLAFRCSLSGSTVTVQPGTVRIHGKGKYRMTGPETATLLGVEEWVFVYWSRVSPTQPFIGHSTNEPTTTGDTSRVPLARYTATAGVYSLAETCHEGDINFDTPLV